MHSSLTTVHDDNVICYSDKTKTVLTDILFIFKTEETLKQGMFTAERWYPICKRKMSPSLRSYFVSHDGQGFKIIQFFWLKNHRGLNKNELHTINLCLASNCRLDRTNKSEGVISVGKADWYLIRKRAKIVGTASHIAQSQMKYSMHIFGYTTSSEQWSKVSTAISVQWQT